MSSVWHLYKVPTGHQLIQVLEVDLKGDFFFKCIQKRMGSFSIFLRTKAAHNYRLNQQYKKYYRIIRTYVYFLKPGGLLSNLKVQYLSG